MSARANADMLARKIAAQCLAQFERTKKKCARIKRGKEFAAMGGCDQDGEWFISAQFLSDTDKREVDAFAYAMGCEE